jgi:uncharacterized protein YdaU (DUF1376 family)
MAKDPSFPWYASDWLGSTKRAMLSPAQRGAYIDLLSHQWGDATCSLPDDDEALEALSGMGEGWLKGASICLRQCFPKHPTLQGRIANPRLLEIRAERDEWLAKSAKGGRKSQRVQRLRRGKGASTTLASKGGSKRQANVKSPSPSPKTPTVSKIPPVSSCPEASSELEIVLVFPVVGGDQKEWGLTAAKRDQYRASFPGLEVDVELLAARQWCIDHETQRKTPGGMLKFLSGWLPRNQNRAKGGSNDQTQRSGRYRGKGRDPAAEAARYR